MKRYTSELNTTNNEKPNEKKEMFILTAVNSLQINNTDKNIAVNVKKSTTMFLTTAL